MRQTRNLQSRIWAVIAAVSIFGSSSSDASEIQLTQRYPISVSRPQLLTTFKVSSCADCGRLEWTKIEISGGSPRVQQTIRIGAATDDLRLKFADIDGDGVREFFVRGVHGLQSAQAYKLGAGNRFNAVPVFDRHTTEANLLQVVKPYAISEANDIYVVRPGIVAVKFFREDDTPVIACYLMDAGALRVFADWDRENSDDAWEGELYIPKRRPDASMQTIAVHSANYREGHKVVWTELCRRSANRYNEKLRKR